MAEANIYVDEQQLCCSVCLELFKDPVTVPCGHNYCMACITQYWDQDRGKGVCFCPQCRHSFSVRPELNRNTVLAELVEKFREKSQHKSRAFSESDGVSCDVCVGEKQAAVSSCLVCLASYCVLHVQPHFVSPAFKKHRLVPACRRLEEKICPAHDRLYEFYCRTHQVCVCCLCTVGEHKDHDTTPAESARDEKTEELMNLNKMMNQRIQQKEKECQVLRKAIKNIKCNADSAREEIERMFAELLVSIEKRRLEVMEQLRVKEETELRGAERVLDRIEMEMVNLQTKIIEIERILQSSDHIDFLQSVLAMTCPSSTEDSVSCPPNHRITFEEVVHSVSDLQKSMEDICSTQMSKISEKVEEIHIFQLQNREPKLPKPKAPLNPVPEPTTREDFLQYSCYLTLEPVADHPNLKVTMGNRAIEWVTYVSSVGKWPQVMCREGLTGRCYWEAEWHGSGVCTIGLCEGGQRGGEGLVMGFGRDTLSWGLDCFHLTYVFHHGNETITIPANKSTTRVGVYIDYKAGTLSFYSVSNKMTLLHRVHARFAQPLYPGFALWANGWQSCAHSYFFNSPLTSETGHMSLKLVNL